MKIISKVQALKGALVTSSMALLVAPSLLMANPAHHVGTHGACPDGSDYMNVGYYIHDEGSYETDSVGVGNVRLRIEGSDGHVLACMGDKLMADNVADYYPHRSYIYVRKQTDPNKGYYLDVGYKVWFMGGTQIFTKWKQQ